MYAVVDIAGKQFRVAPSDRIRVPSLKHKEGEKVVFTRVLLVADESRVTVGNPLVAGAAVEAEVLGHGKGDTVIVLRKKKCKGFRVRRGHRQGYTRIEITRVGA
ncbi:MAG: 50S ribosomal protein L21 [Bacteroidota bacterium]